jgi:hypothetical protein
MSERLSTTPERHAEHLKVTVERPKAVEYGAAERAESIERAQAIVAAETRQAERPQVPQVPVDDRPQLIDNAVKMFRMRRNLSHVQNKLKPAQKAFSKVIHQPLVHRVSESAGKTVARPSGMLGGGVAAFVGSLSYLVLAYKIGFTYNYLLFLGFFFGGFIVGVGIEYGLYGLRKLRG